MDAVPASERRDKRFIGPCPERDWLESRLEGVSSESTGGFICFVIMNMICNNRRSRWKLVGGTKALIRRGMMKQFKFSSGENVMVSA